MPRVYEQTARTSKNRRVCQKCREEVKPGDRYYQWSFRYGGTRNQHVACGRPLRSQLTQSLLSSIYAAEEEFEKLPEDATWGDRASAVEAIAEAAGEVMEQYRAAAENFGGAGEHAERADELEQWVDSLRELQEAYEAASEAVEAAEAVSFDGCPL